MKVDVTLIVRDQFRTLHRGITPGLSFPDLFILYAFPIGVGATGFALRWSIAGISDLLVAVSLLAGLLFNLLVPIFELARKITDIARSGEKARIRKILIGELYSNVSYSILVALSAAVLLGACSALGIDHPGRYLSAIAAIILIHFLLTLMMILKRMRSIFVTEFGATELSSEPRS